VQGPVNREGAAMSIIQQMSSADLKDMYQSFNQDLFRESDFDTRVLISESMSRILLELGNRK